MRPIAYTCHSIEFLLKICKTQSKIWSLVNWAHYIIDYCHTLENHPKIFTWCAVLRTLPQPTFLPNLLKTHTNNSKLKEIGTQRGYMKSFPTCINLNYKIQNCFLESKSNAYIPSIQRLLSLFSLSPSQRVMLTSQAFRDYIPLLPLSLSRLQEPF